MTQRKAFIDLDLSNAFLFAAALEEEETCQMVLELILGTHIGPVKVRAERSILVSSDFRSVRLDIYANDEVDVAYNVEMQNQDKKNLAKRSRYHQAAMDVSSLKPGEEFNDLRPSYIVFICTFDPFGDALYRYTFEERCLENDISLGDGTKKIFLSTEGKNDDDVPLELIHFLRYVDNSNDTYVAQTDDVIISRLHNKVVALKKSRELEERYMQFEELLKDSEKAGMEKGIEQGIEKGIEQGIELGKKNLFNLISCMTASGIADQISRLATDEEFYKEMLKKYNI